MGAPALVQLCDLLAVTGRHQEGQAGYQPLDWPAFTGRAVARSAAPYALAALGLASRLLDAPVPSEAMGELAAAVPPRLRERLVRLDLAAVMARTQRRPARRLRGRLFRGLADRAEAARWAPSAGHFAAVCLAAVRFDHSDTFREIVGQPLKTERTAGPLPGNARPGDAHR
jgi:hypothetical protein